MLTRMGSVSLLLLGAFSAVRADVPAPLFEAHDVVEVTLAARFSKVFAQRKQETSTYHPATLTLNADTSEERIVGLVLKTRGNFRLDRKNCRYPPLFFKFEAADTAGTVFEGQHILPVVTHCRSTGRYRQYLLQEYLAYRILEILTDKSIQVRLLHINYVNAKNSRSRGNYLAFAVEHWDDMAERLNANRIEPDKFNPLQGDPYDTLLMNVYQYMIGNTDWSAVYGHNIVLLENKDNGSVSPVPFDFDSAGCVDAAYATPSENLPIRSVRQRLYRGLCRPAEQYPPVFDRFNAQRAQVYEIYASQQDLSESERGRSLRYFDLFYDTINSPEESRRKIIDACRGTKN